MTLFLCYQIWLALWLINSAFAQNCSSPYQLVGHQCLFIDNDLVGSWEEIGSFCQAINGELVNLKDLNSLGNIFGYILENGMNDVSYWTGANDLFKEGMWAWNQRGDQLRPSMPLWGDNDLDVMYPSGGIDENCGFLNMEEYYFLDDTDCNHKHGTICELVIPNETKLEDSAIAAIKEKDCVHPFQLIGSACLLIDTLNPDIYSNKEAICKGIGGHMAKIDNANLLAEIYDFLFLNDIIYQDLYIGATHSNNLTSWKWADGTPVQQGTPYWGDWKGGGQQPNDNYIENCVVLWQRDHFFFADVTCFGQHGSICQYDP